MTTFHYGLLSFSHKNLEMVSSHILGYNETLFICEFSANTPPHTMDEFVRRIKDELTKPHDFGYVYILPIRVGCNLSTMTHVFKKNFPEFYITDKKCLSINRTETGYNAAFVDSDNISKNSFYLYV